MRRGVFPHIKIPVTKTFKYDQLWKGAFTYLYVTGEYNKLKSNCSTGIKNMVTFGRIC